MYENYLVEPEAIASAINLRDVGREEPISPAAVSDWLRLHGGEEKYFGSDDAVDYLDQAWVERVSGSKILKELFVSTTNARCEYDKVRDGLLLTEYHIKYPTEKIRGLVAMLVSLVKG